MITVSWYPGALKGTGVQKTQQLIVRSLQLWQGRCGVRFGVLPAGQRTQITFYPYAGAMPGIMAAYQQTGQILYSTTYKIPLQKCPMYFAHEVGHCFGWGHSHPDRTEAMMHWRGSEVDYMEPAEGRRAIAQFGRTTNPDHPWSLTFIGDEIRKFEPAYKNAIEKRNQFDEAWNRFDLVWKEWKLNRQNATTPEEREKANERVMFWYAKREDAGVKRKEWNQVAKEQRDKLLPLWKKWAKINRQWNQVSAANISESMMGDKPCVCFEEHVDGPTEMGMVDLVDVFRNFKKLKTQPLEVN